MAPPGWETVGDSSFGDLEEWKARALAAEQELEEHQETSAELEAELEKELAEKEEQLKVWQSKYQQLDAELSGANERLTSRLQEVSATADKAEQSRVSLVDITTAQTSKIRKLEQTVDDLERNEREAEATVATLEKQLADTIERAVVQESSLLDDKQRLEVENQRLRDTYRDLEQDLAVLRLNKETLPSSGSRQRCSTAGISTQSSRQLSQRQSAAASNTSPKSSKSTQIDTAIQLHKPQSAVTGKQRPPPVGHSGVSPTHTSGSSTNSNTSENSVNAAITPKRRDLIFRSRKHKQGSTSSRSGKSFGAPESTPKLVKSYTSDFRQTPKTPTTSTKKALLFTNSPGVSALPSSIETPKKKAPFYKRVFSIGRSKNGRNKHGSGVSTSEYSSSTVVEGTSEMESEGFHTPVLRLEDFTRE